MSSENEGKTQYGWRHTKWNKNRLTFNGKTVVELVPHDTVPKHWHLKFAWRDEKTPEFFNLTNAKCNARDITIHRLNLNGQGSLGEARTAI